MPLLFGESGGSCCPALSSPNTSYFCEVFTGSSAGLWPFGFLYGHLEHGIGQLIRVFWEWLA